MCSNAYSSCTLWREPSFSTVYLFLGYTNVPSSLNAPPGQLMCSTGVCVSIASNSPCTSRKMVNWNQYQVSENAQNIVYLVASVVTTVS